jgi:protein NEDD1
LGRGSGGGSGGGAQFQMQVMQSSLQQMFNDFRDEVFEQVQNLHIDMIRQFHTQQLEITTLLKTLTAQNQATMDENRALREEIEQLRKMY